MTPSEAREIILIHACALDDVYDPRMNTSFLGSLNPYSGLKVENFHEIMMALKVLTPTLHEDFIDRKLIAALWDICEQSRLEGLERNGRLRRNNLILEDDVAKLKKWVDRIEHAVNILLHRMDIDEYMVREAPH